MKKLILSVLAASSLITLEAAPKYEGLRKAQEVQAREGIGNVLKKIRAGEEIVVAYLGGSITSMNGWRNMTTDWLKETYPNAKFKEIHAAIGGTGSGLGVFRVGWDALRHNPDLLFIEFATNDGGAQPEAIWKNMEGIVRQTWKKDPTTDIVFTYTITGSMKEEYLAGNCNRAASAMEMLADHYGIPSINFGPRVAALLAQNKLVMGAKDIETAVPKQEPEYDRKVKELRKNDKRLLFANDSVHPRQEGHLLYRASITNGFTQMKDTWKKPSNHAAKLATPFIEGNMENAKMVDITPDMLTGSWEKLPETDRKMKSFSKRMGQIWSASKPGDTLKFKFKGTFCSIYDLLGPDGGQVWITVDGKKSKRVIPRFDSYCTYHRIASLWVFSGKDGEHTVEITVDKDQPSRKSVAFRLKDPDKELAEEKYQGTKFWASKIQLVGELIK
jgi:lysophospholipase L1-like esterase